MGWDYKREEGSFGIIPEGRHRVRIDAAERQMSKRGNEMIKLTLAVSGYGSRLFHYIVFMPEHPEITNRNLTQLFDSFAGIKEGDFDESHWVGKVGACTVKHEDYNGSPSAKVGYFIKPSKATDLPAWKEPEGGGKAAKPAQGAAGADGFTQADEELPFF